MQSRRTFFHVSRAFAAAALFACLAAPALSAQQASASAHLVSPDQLRQQVQSASSTRQANMDNLARFLSTPAAEKAMRDAKIDPIQVRNAIPTLNDQELANLSQRAAGAQKAFAAGTLSNNDLLIIILILVVVILIAVIR
jgi:pyruvate/2-oxoglutarate dehydrogenase complex dihydrolipoamide acyltransferase (E2) component